MFKKLVGWLGIPLIATLVIVIPAGAVYAYTAWTGHASITISEPITVRSTTPSWDPATKTWTANMFVGDTKGIELYVKNNATQVVQNVTLAIVGTTTGLAFTIEPVQPMTLAVGEERMVTLGVTALGDAVVGSQTFSIVVSR